MDPHFSFHQTQAMILCCLCGTKILPNPSNMCVNCVRSQVDITEGIAKQVIVPWCKGCGRYHQPPNAWIVAQLESRELLAYCLKRVKNLNKVRLVDAGFIYTEPHSKRLKVKVKVQKEAFVNTILEQSFVIEFVVHNEFCPDCHKQATPNTWTAVVQLRQKVSHKRTFLYLEQVILKYNMQSQCLKIKEFPNGLDFYFAKKSHAIKFTEFLTAITPLKTKTSEQLISRDEQNSVYNFKYTFSCELVPICREDLVFLPKSTAAALGYISPLAVCKRVNTNIILIDPFTLQMGEMQSSLFWREPFFPLATIPQMIEYVVLDILPCGPSVGSMLVSDVSVVRSSDFGSNDQQFIGKTHLGNILHVGDSCMGYDLSTLNSNSTHLDDSKIQLPDFILVKKKYHHKSRKRRPWRLRDLKKEQTENYHKKGKGGEAGMRDRDDYERFLRELEEDKELRVNVNVFKKDGMQSETETDTEMITDGEEDDAPEIPLEELIDQLSIRDVAVGADLNLPSSAFEFD